VHDEAVHQRLSKMCSKIVNAINPVPLLLQAITAALGSNCINRAHLDVRDVEGPTPVQTRKRRAAYFNRWVGVSKEFITFSNLYIYQGVFGIDSKGLHLVAGFALLCLLIPVLSGEIVSSRLKRTLLQFCCLFRISVETFTL